MNRLSVAKHFNLENKRALYLFLLTLATSGSSLLTFVVLARSMSVSDYGLYAYILSIVTLGGVVASLGVPTLATREIARLSKERSSGEVTGVLVFGLTMLASGTAIVGTLFFILGTTRMSAHLVLASIFLIYLLQTNLFLVAALNGASESVQAAVPAAIGGALFLLALVALHFLHVAVAPLAVVLIQDGATILILVLQTRQIVEVFSLRTKARPRIRWKYWFLESLPFLGAGIAFYINTSVDIFLLGTIKGPLYTAVYQVGTKAATVLVMALGSVAMVYQPLLSRAHFSGDMEDVKRSSKIISRVGFFVAVAAAATLVPLRNVLIPFIFGKAYIEAGLVMSILILARLINASVGAVGPYLSMTEKGGLLFIGLAAESMMNIAFNLLLIPAYGIIGSAVATGTSMILMNVSMAVYIDRKFGVSMCVV